MGFFWLCPMAVTENGFVFCFPKQLNEVYDLGDVRPKCHFYAYSYLQLVNMYLWLIMPLMCILHMHVTRNCVAMMGSKGCNGGDTNSHQYHRSKKYLVT